MRSELRPPVFRLRRRACWRWRLGVTRRRPGAVYDFGQRRGMQLVDLTHKFTIHTPGWVGYPSPKLSYFQRHATNGIVSQLLELPLHSGTHFDSQMHIVSGGADIASLPLDRLCRRGLIVAIADEPD